jgi:N-acetyl sugar amidotransferase
LKYCARCVYPANHPLRLVFDDAGVCSGCRVHEEKDALDWPERLLKLKALVRGYKARTRSIHDCIVPVSGARDSHFIVHVVKNLLGLRPLLVTYNKHYNTETGIRNLAYLRSIAGADIFTTTASPERVKRVTRETLRLRGSMYWHCIAGQTVFPVQTAVRFKIPLIIWGAHQGVDQVGMFSHLDEVEMTRKYREEHDLMELDEELLLAEAPMLTEADIEPFRYPHDKELEAIGVRGIYLNNYIRWDSKAQHEQMIAAGYGYETRAQQRTFDTYNDVDCFHYSGLHDYIKYLKWGYGKATDHVSREIRLKRLTREEGISLIARYETKQPEDANLFLEWLGMPAAEFWFHINRHRDPSVWQQHEDGWIPRDSIIRHQADASVDDVRLGVTERCEFLGTSPRASADRDTYTLIGRGWVDRGTGAVGSHQNVRMTSRLDG